MSVVPDGSGAVMAARSASAGSPEGVRAAPALPGSDPRSTTVSGQRASSWRSALVVPARAGRYPLTCPLELARARAAPGPTAVEQLPRPAAEASRPHCGLVWNCWLNRVSADIAVIWDGVGPAVAARAPDRALTGGSPGQGPFSV